MLAYREFEILCKIAKQRKIGDRIACPVCGKGIVKDAHRRMYCSDICKDQSCSMRAIHKRNIK